MPEDKILQIISEGAGTQFDPNIVNAFLKLYHAGQFNKITGTNLEKQEIMSSA